MDNIFNKEIRWLMYGLGYKLVIFSNEQLTEYKQNAR